MDGWIVAWFIASTVGIPVLVFLACCALGSHRSRAARVYGLAAALLFWAHPVTQKLLVTEPTVTLSDELERYVGEPLWRVMADFGEPRSNEDGRASYQASPWYAPVAVIGVPQVHVLYSNPDVVWHVYFDD